MTNFYQANFAQQDLHDLQRLRALTFAFQRMIANLDANEQNNEYNEQFNKILAEARNVLRRYGLSLDTPRVVSSGLLAERGQKISTRLSGIVIFGVMLALVGLGINSVILEDVIINSLGCLISTGGILLVMGALVVWGVTSTRRKLTNLGDLYLHCEALIQQLDQILKTAVPSYSAPPIVDTPNIPSAASLTLDSLEKQTADWKEKMVALNQQRQMLGPAAPVELTTTINYVQRELDRIEYELVNLRETVDLPPTFPPEAPPPPRPVEPPPALRPDPGALNVARAFTEDMPVLRPDPEPVLEPQPVETETEPEMEPEIEPESEEDSPQS